MNRSPAAHAATDTQNTTTGNDPRIRSRSATRTGASKPRHGALLSVGFANSACNIANEQVRQKTRIQVTWTNDNGIGPPYGTNRLSACNASQRWIGAMLARRPYRTVESLLALAEQSARSLDWEDVRQALEAHPRIGDRATGQTTEDEWSLTVANPDCRTHRALDSLGAEVVEEQPIGLEDALIAYVGRRGEKSFLLGTPGSGR